MRVVYGPGPTFRYSGLQNTHLMRHNVDDVIDHLQRSRPNNVLSVMPIPLVVPEILTQVSKIQVCRIHAGHYMTMKPIVTFYRFSKSTLQSFMMIG